MEKSAVKEKTQEIADKLKKMQTGVFNDLMEFGIIPDMTDPDIRSYLSKFAIALIGLAITGAIIYKASMDPTSKTSKFYVYSFLIVLPVIIGALIISPVFSKPMDIYTLYFYLTVIFVFIIAVYMFYRVLNPTSVIFATYAFKLIGIVGFIVGLAIVYRIFVRTIINMRGWMGFILKVLFYLPCLLIDLLEYVFEDLKNSPKMVVVLFVLEILVILAYLYLPKLIKVTIPSNTKVLLKNPVFLTQTTTIATGQDLAIPITDVNNPGRSENQFRRNFSISMWVYVNQQPASYAAYSKETDIFRYGLVGTEQGHPRVTYFNDVKNGKPDQCIVYASNKATDASMVIQLTAQAWNHLVINYNDSSVDLFLNGNLAQSVTLDFNTTPSFDIADVVQVGSGDNSVTKSGLMGAICNVTYTNRALLPIEIAGSYNSKRYKNPPI